MLLSFSLTHLQQYSGLGFTGLDILVIKKLLKFWLWPWNLFHSSKETSVTCKGILTSCLSKSNNAILIQRRTHWLVMKCEKFQIAWSETKVNIIMDHKPQEITHSLTFKLPACNKRWSFSLQCTDLKWSIDLDQRKMNILKNWGCLQVIMSRTEGMWLWDRQSTFCKRLWQKLGL